MARTVDVDEGAGDLSTASPRPLETAALVRLVRLWLDQGVSRANLASAVRIADVKHLTGGFVADEIAEVRLDVRAVVKVGAADLLGHSAIMRVVNRTNERLGSDGRRTNQRAIFPEIMAVVPATKIGWSGSGRGRLTYVMLMEALVGYQTFETLLLDKQAPPSLARNTLRRVLGMLRLIHSHRREKVDALRDLPVVVDPFSDRILGRLRDVIDADPDLAPMWTSPGRVLGYDCPPLRVLLGRLKRWTARRASESTVRLVHGDPHLGNVLVRRRGARTSVRFIDPNPNLGFSQPIYDYGKVALVLTPVGWVRKNPGVCRTAWKPAASGRAWSLGASLKGVDAGVEARRNVLAEDVTEDARSALSPGLPEWQQWLHIATASAHIGLAALKGQPQDANPRRFALAYGLAELAKCDFQGA